jgi:hypothetical protein
MPHGPTLEPQKNSAAMRRPSDFTQGTNSIDGMNWMFSYYREHPTNTLFDAGIGLSNTLKRAYLESKRAVKNSDARQP